jgi:hypothetical protein
VAEGLRAAAADYGHTMDAKAMKQRYFNSYSISRNRMLDWKARR